MSVSRAPSQSSDKPTESSTVGSWSLYLFVAGLAAAVLLYTVVEQLFDTNFQALWEATAILSGDHPYRDFYQIGWPLVTALSALGQWLTGHRLIGEFLIHWMFIIAGMLLGFHLSLRLSHSVVASLATILVALVMLASAATFHFPKLFVYPLAVLMMWRYVNRPDPARAAAIGVVTAVAFLFRHDHGLYLGIASLFALGLARVAAPSRTARSVLKDTLAYAAAAFVVLAPWALLVQVNEGLIDYVWTRVAWGAEWAPPASVYSTLYEINPLGVFEWPDANSWRPSTEQGLRWLMHITALIPLLMLLSAGCDAIALRRQGRSVTPDVWSTMLAAGLVILIVHRLVREGGYFAVVLPLTAAFGARLLAGSPMAAAPSVASSGSLAWARRGWRAARCGVAVGVLLTTTAAAVGHLDWDLFAPNELDELVVTYRHLMNSPAIDVYQPTDEARQTNVASWKEHDADARQRVMIRYMHECTRPGDRVLVTGSTPYHVGYYIQRPIAGGHLQWHHGWRSDAPHEQQSLELLEDQSVPFAFSTNDPVLDDLKAYPRIHAYLKEHYLVIEGTEGLLLADARRQPTGSFGALGFPCFR